MSCMPDKTPLAVAVEPRTGKLVFERGENLLHNDTVFKLSQSLGIALQS